MRALAVAGFVVIVCSLGAATHTDAATWCRSDGGRSYCNFPTLQHCMAMAGVMGGRCAREALAASHASYAQARPRPYYTGRQICR